jgi:glycosyltransferase involved in cell wall biosynthesis
MAAVSARVALNAQLLFGGASYRSAGIHHYIDSLLRHLPEAGPDFRYTVFVGSGQPQMPDARLWRTALPTRKPWVRIFWEQIAQPAALLRLAPHLLHSLAFVSPLLLPCPSVVTVYDLSFRLAPDRFPAAQRLYLSAFTAHSCRRARRIIAISQSTRSDLARVFGLPPQKIDVAYPGVDPVFRPWPRAQVEAFRAQKGLPDGFILFVGTLEPRKNIDVLLRAFAALRSRRPDLRLVIAGARGWLYQGLFRLVEELGLSEAVTFPGFVPAEDLPGWYNASQVFAYPSSLEGFGMPVVEALACGRPVVTSNVSSLPEAAGEAALLAPVGDAPALAGALERALDQGPEALGLGPAQAARFTWRTCAEATVASYRLALSAPAGQGSQR